MELWIRSQDRKRLIKCEKLITVEFTERTECEIWNDTVKLGTYKNIERALEVLDEIQRHITKHNETVVIRICNEDFIKQNPVYEMPKEWC